MLWLEEHANDIGRRIIGDNALESFPKLKRWLWKNKPAK